MQNFQTLSPNYDKNLWQNIANLPTFNFENNCFSPPNLQPIADESEQTAWLIALFNDLFVEQNVILVHVSDEGKDEPEYLPATNNQPAKICFAHGYFASALHEISHWTIAGKQRRKLNDFGYWYAPDGRSEEQQRQFEQFEIKPQAIECLFTLACGRPFQVSQDNLSADFETKNSTFASDVYQLAKAFLNAPQKLPKDAQKLLAVLYLLNHLSDIYDVL
ncbi:MAG: elongation factor P hydroxylase [Moraxellaceae bacterium]|nr:elongation factor P hydroxylase [Moraxellaceae bacterium]